jgi:hypothetical protein
METMGIFAISDTSRDSLRDSCVRAPRAKHVRYVYANDVAFALPDLETCRLIFQSNDVDDDKVVHNYH